MLSHQTAAGQL